MLSSLSRRTGKEAGNRVFRRSLMFGQDGQSIRLSPVQAHFKS